MQKCAHFFLYVEIRGSGNDRKLKTSKYHERANPIMVLEYILLVHQAYHVHCQPRLNQAHIKEISVSDVICEMNLNCP